MAGNSEIAPTEPPGRRRKPTEGGSRLRDHFRDSIRDALSGVDVDALHGRPGLPVPTDVSLVTREAVTDLETELAALRAERAALETRKAQTVATDARRGAVAAPAPWEEAEADPAELEEAEEREVQVSSVPWSPARAMVPLASPPGLARPGEKRGRGGRRGQPRVTLPPRPAAPVLPARPAAAAPAPAAPVARPAAAGPARPSPPNAAPPAAPPDDAELTDAELESVVAPLLAELASLRAEVRDLRGEPAGPRGRDNRQMVKLVVGVLIGFALIVIALAVVLKA
jgi:hypothetical protein